jgi:hypothetical protein
MPLRSLPDIYLYTPELTRNDKMTDMMQTSYDGDGPVSTCSDTNACQTLTHNMSIYIDIYNLYLNRVYTRLFLVQRPHDTKKATMCILKPS